MLCAFSEKHVKTFLIVSKRDAAHMVQSAGHARNLFELFVKADRISLQGRHIGVPVQCVKSPCRMPS